MTCHAGRSRPFGIGGLFPFRNRRFKCCFSLLVHLVEGLPLDFNGSSLCVHWKRRDVILVTRPAKVLQGMVEFEL